MCARNQRDVEVGWLQARPGEAEAEAEAQKLTECGSCYHHRLIRALCDPWRRLMSHNILTRHQIVDRLHFCVEWNCETAFFKILL